MNLNQSQLISRVKNKLKARGLTYKDLLAYTDIKSSTLYYNLYLKEPNKPDSYLSADVEAFLLDFLNDKVLVLTDSELINNLTELRIRKGWTQLTVATLLGVSSSMVSKWNAKEYRLMQKTRMRIVRLLNDTTSS